MKTLVAIFLVAIVTLTGVQVVNANADLRLRKEVVVAAVAQPRVAYYVRQICNVREDLNSYLNDFMKNDHFLPVDSNSFYTCFLKEMR